GDLTPLLKAQVCWIVARHDRAWYALGQAQRRLRELGWSDDRIWQLDDAGENFSRREQLLFTLSRKLASSPITLTDHDVAQALTLASPREIVQLISYVTDRALFDRFTEAAGLRLEQ